METRAKYALIGLFTICVVAAAFGFVFWFTGSHGGAALKPYDVVFDNIPVTGLSRGGSVLFNGIKVGEVGDLSFDGRDPRKVIARINIPPNVPIKVTTKAKLEFSGLTGVASIQLYDSDPKQPDLMPKRGETVPRLYATPSPTLQDVLQAAQTATRHADDILVQVDQIVAENRTPISHIVANVERLSDALDADKINKAVDSISSLASRLDVGKINHAVGEIDSVASSLDKLAGTLRDHSADVADFIKSAKETAASLDRSSAQVETFLNSGAPASLTRSLANIEDITKHIDPQKLGSTIDNVQKFATSLGNNSQRVDDIGKNADQLVTKLNASADKVDKILNGVNDLVNSPNGKNAFAEFADASRSVRRLADDLDKRSAELLANLTRFSGSGLRDFQQFAVEGQRTLGDISRTLQGVQRNPQQFLLGSKPSLPEYGN